MTVTHRLIPPAKGAASIIVNGRTYLTSGGAQDVPEFDSSHLQANGWTYMSLSGNTASRPTSTLGTAPLYVGQKYYDTTLGYYITWDGSAWRDPTDTSR